MIEWRVLKICALEWLLLAPTLCGLYTVGFPLAAGQGTGIWLSWGIPFVIEQLAAHSLVHRRFAHTVNHRNALPVHSDICDLEVGSVTFLSKRSSNESLCFVVGTQEFALQARSYLPGQVMTNWLPAQN